MSNKANQTFEAKFEECLQLARAIGSKQRTLFFLDKLGCWDGELNKKIACLEDKLVQRKIDFKAKVKNLEQKNYDLLKTRVEGRKE